MDGRRPGALYARYCLDPAAFALAKEPWPPLRVPTPRWRSAPAWRPQPPCSPPTDGMGPSVLGGRTLEVLGAEFDRFQSLVETISRLVFFETHEVRKFRDVRAFEWVEKVPRRTAYIIKCFMQFPFVQETSDVHKHSRIKLDRLSSSTRHRYDRVSRRGRPQTSRGAVIMLRLQDETDIT